MSNTPDFGNGFMSWISGGFPIAARTRDEPGDVLPADGWYGGKHSDARPERSIVSDRMTTAASSGEHQDRLNRAELASISR
jgi:hypothetical protein